MRQNKKVVENVIDAYFKELEMRLMQNYIYPAKKMALDDLVHAKRKLGLKREKLEHIQQ